WRSRRRSIRPGRPVGQARPGRRRARPSARPGQGSVTMDALAVVAGLAVVVLALLPGSGLDASKRAAMVATGLVFGGYGAFVMAQTSGSWSFPAVGFVLPIALGATVVR